MFEIRALCFLKHCFFYVGNYCIIATWTLPSTHSSAFKINEFIELDEWRNVGNHHWMESTKCIEGLSNFLTFLALDPTRCWLSAVDQARIGHLICHWKISIDSYSTNSLLIVQNKVARLEGRTIIARNRDRDCQERRKRRPNLLISKKTEK